MEIVESCALSCLKSLASWAPAATTPSFAASLVGELARLFHAVQKADIGVASPELEGSLNAAWAWPSSSAWVEAPLRALFWVAVLGVQIRVADAFVVGHPDAGAQLRPLAGQVRQRRDFDRWVRLEDGALARVAFGVRVRDVVTGDVDRLLVGEQSAQRRLQSLEGRDAHR